MKVIGLTGGVGSGKSTVGEKMQQNFSVKLVMTDDLGHLAMEPGTLCNKNIQKTFGNEILAEDGYIDRGKLAKIVFSDKEKLKQLNEIIHPWVKEYLNEDIEQEKRKGVFSYYVMESAILFQSGLDKMCHEIWFVDAAEEIRRKRLKESRGYTDQRIDDIMDEQRENEGFKEKCNRIISTNKGEASILPQLEEVFGKIK